MKLLAHNHWQNDSPTRFVWKSTPNATQEFQGKTVELTAALKEKKEVLAKTGKELEKLSKEIYESLRLAVQDLLYNDYHVGEQFDEDEHNAAEWLTEKDARAILEQTYLQYRKDVFGDEDMSELSNFFKDLGLRHEEEKYLAAGDADYDELLDDGDTVLDLDESTNQDLGADVTTAFEDATANATTPDVQNDPTAAGNLDVVAQEIATELATLNDVRKKTELALTNITTWLEQHAAEHSDNQGVIDANLGKLDILQGCYADFDGVPKGTNITVGDIITDNDERSLPFRKFTASYTNNEDMQDIFADVLVLVDYPGLVTDPDPSTAVQSAYFAAKDQNQDRISNIAVGNRVKLSQMFGNLDAATYQQIATIDRTKFITDAQYQGKVGSLILEKLTGPNGALYDYINKKTTELSTNLQGSKKPRGVLARFSFAPEPQHQLLFSILNSLQTQFNIDYKVGLQNHIIQQAGATEYLARFREKRGDSVNLVGPSELGQLITSEVATMVESMNGHEIVKEFRPVGELVLNPNMTAAQADQVREDQVIVKDLYEFARTGSERIPAETVKSFIDEHLTGKPFDRNNIAGLKKHLVEYDKEKNLSGMWGKMFRGFDKLMHKMPKWLRNIVGGLLNRITGGNGFTFDDEDNLGAYLEGTGHEHLVPKPLTEEEKTAQEQQQLEGKWNSLVETGNVDEIAAAYTDENSEYKDLPALAIFWGTGDEEGQTLHTDVRAKAWELYKTNNADVAAVLDTDPGYGKLFEFMNPSNLDCIRPRVFKADFFEALTMEGNTVKKILDAASKEDVAAVMTASDLRIMIKRIQLFENMSPPKLTVRFDEETSDICTFDFDEDSTEPFVLKDWTAESLKGMTEFLEGLKEPEQEPTPEEREEQSQQAVKSFQDTYNGTLKDNLFQSFLSDTWLGDLSGMAGGLGKLPPKFGSLWKEFTDVAGITPVISPNPDASLWPWDDDYMVDINGQRTKFDDYDDLVEILNDFKFKNPTAFDESSREITAPAEVDGSEDPDLADQVTDFADGTGIPIP